MTENVCGHVNKHSPKPFVKCKLIKGHEGNHKGVSPVRTSQLSPHLSNEEFEKYEIETDENGLTWHVGEIESEWNDIAGTPANEIIPRSPGVEIIDSASQKAWERDELVSDLQKELAEQKSMNAKFEERFAALESKEPKKQAKK
jgi:hypothetical protein